MTEYSVQQCHISRILGMLEMQCEMRDIPPRVRRDCPDPYFFPEPGPDPVGIGIGIPNHTSTGSGPKSRTMLQRDRDRDRDETFRDLVNNFISKYNFLFIQNF
jgi:hypothetical protein